MKVSKGRYDYSKREGDKAENEFVLLMQERGNVVKKATPEEDMYKHIDYFVNGIGVDVKGNRHLECIWLEIRNVRGDKGWLMGESDYIAFDVKELNSFCIFKRELLLEWVKENVKEYTDSKAEFNKFYTRKKWGKKDILTKVKYKTIEHLITQRINYGKA